MKVASDRKRPVAAGADEKLDSLVTVLDLIRSGSALTRPALERRSGLGRTLVAQRLAQLLGSGLVEQGELGPSSGGRAPRELRFRAENGHLMVADLGATRVAVGLADLGGRLLAQHEEPSDVARGPEATLSRLEQMFDELLASRSGAQPPVWGVGIGVPGPVEFATGRPIAPPIMPGWDGYPIRDRFGARYGAPTWVDNDVNLKALGELQRGAAQGERDVLCVKIGTGIGAGLVSGGRLHRGAQGAAGDIGHVAVVDDASIVCRCGNVGCLEALAGGAALARDATAAAVEGRSRVLTERLRDREQLDAHDVAQAAEYGDPVAVELLARSGRLVGQTLATLVNFYNPSLVVLVGRVASAGDGLLAAIRETVYRRSLPLATRDLRIVRSRLGNQSGLFGAVSMVTLELFSRERIGLWITAGSPAGRPELARGVPEPDVANWIDG